MKLQRAKPYNVNLLECFFDAGGSRFGTIPTTKFGSALVHALSRLNLSVEMITSLVDHYGCGDPVDKRSAYSRLAQFEQVAFMDLCEDVDKAENERRAVSLPIRRAAGAGAGDAIARRDGERGSRAALRLRGSSGV